MEEVLTLNFVEGDTMGREIISFPISGSRTLDEGHQYFEKVILWNLIKWVDTEEYPYEAIEEDEKNGVIYNEISERLITEVGGIANTIIEEKINLEECFAFEYKPKEFDRLTLMSRYKYAEIKGIERPSSSKGRRYEYMSFTFVKGFWEIDIEITKRTVLKSSSGIVEIKRT